MKDDDGPLKAREGAVASREISGEMVMLHLETSRYLGVNESGTLLWAALVEGSTRSGLIRLLVDRFSLDEQTAERDVDAFVAQCKERDLLDR